MIVHMSVFHISAYIRHICTYKCLSTQTFHTCIYVPHICTVFISVCTYPRICMFYTPVCYVHTHRRSTCLCVLDVRVLYTGNNSVTLAARISPTFIAICLQLLQFWTVLNGSDCHFVWQHAIYVGLLQHCCFSRMEVNLSTIRICSLHYLQGFFFFFFFCCSAATQRWSWPPHS